MTGPLRVVSIGGGTGLSCLLRGVKRFTDPRTNNPAIDITAIVTVSDDGGSSGRLRREFAVLSPGDIRSCLVALSQDSDLLSQLFQYRFRAGRGLKGHSFGNLFLTALTDITGDFPEAVARSSEVLKVAGRIFPGTAAKVVLEAELEDGRRISGESRIGRSRRRIRRIHMKPANAKPLAETIEAIATADLITFGPGSLFTSIIPNLLIRGVPEAIRSSRAIKACFVNLMSQPGETTGFCASDHVDAIHLHAGGRLIDCVVVSNSGITPSVRKRYAEQNAAPVEIDSAALEAMGIEIVGADLLEKAVPAGSKARHNPEAIGAVTRALALRGRDARLRLLRK
jgi:uncharacterized cofD-like protein